MTGMTERWMVKECPCCNRIDSAPRSMCDACGTRLDVPTFEVVRATAARSKDPSTSKLAALRQEPRSGSQRRRALEAFKEAYPGGLTAGEVETRTGIKGVWKRISELKQGGHIAVIGQRPNPDTGQEAEIYVWIHSEQLF